MAAVVKQQIDGEWLSETEIAKRVGIHRQTAAARLEDLGYEPDEERSKLKAKVHWFDEEMLFALKSAKDTVAAMKIRDLRVSAQLKEFKLREQMGQYVAIVEATERVQSVMSRMYKEFTQIQPKRLASRLVKAQTAAEVARILKTDTDKIFGKLRDNNEAFVPVVKIMSSAALKVVTEAIRRAIPAGTSSVSAWAEQNRYVERGARKGKWSNKTVPFATEIMDAFVDSDIREVVFMKAAQVAGSEILANVVGYYIEIEPTEIAYVAEKEDKTRAWMVESFDSMVRATPSLKRLVKTSDEDNNQRVKRFPGGQFFGFWATSPAELSSRPVQVMLFDEKSAYKPTAEGDPVKLGEARTKTYDGFEKIGKIGTPRNAGDSADIEADFLRGDKRQFWVPCPSCDETQLLAWANCQWDDDPNLAYMACVECGVQLEYDDLQEMLERGRWIKDADLETPMWPDHVADPEVASFRINQLYSPFVRWSRMVKDFLEAKRKGPGSLQMQTWVNTALGEPWRPYEKIDYGDLSLNREDYPAEVPPGVLVLTAGVDVQGNRLEYEIVGWGRDNESWSIEIGILDGDPGISDVWDEMTERLTRVFMGEEKEFRVQCAFIDSGYHANQVYRFAKKHEGRKWYACKGLGDPTKPIVSKATWVGSNPKVRMVPVGTTAAKDEIFSALKVTELGPGYCHFPSRPEYDEAYLKQLCSERKVLRARLGQTYYVYEKIGANVRNEALDLRVYATAARVKLNPNYDRIAGRRLQHTEPVTRDDAALDSLSVKSVETAPQSPPPGKVVPFRGSLTKKNNPFTGYKP